MIRTERLDLVPATVEALHAELEGPAALAMDLNVQVPAGWPPDLYDRAATEYILERLSGEDGLEGWWMHYIVLRRPERGRGLLIGTCGYKGPPDETGTVEIGYGILAEHQRRGYASEASKGLVDRAFASSSVKLVIAETLPELTASIGLLEKLGFRFVGEGSEEGVIRYELPRPGP